MTLERAGAACDGFPAPFERYRTDVQPDWIDGQGHMNVGYYGLVFDAASFAIITALGLGPAYGEAHGHGTFVVETHTIHQGELLARDVARVRTQILSADEKRLHLGHELIRDADERRVAAQELMYLHVDLRSRRVVPFLPEVRDAVLAARRRHAKLARPEWPGRRIAPAPGDVG